MYETPILLEVHEVAQLGQVIETIAGTVGHKPFDTSSEPYHGH